MGMEPPGTPTPGPWKVEPSESGPHALWITAPLGDPAIGYDRWSGLAEVYGCEDHDPEGAGDRQMRANAHLIAAAPDLYAALKECREAVAAAMRVVADLDQAHRLGMSAETRQQRFVDELHAAGVKDGFGVRADAALATAEGRR